jgi:cell division protein FtsL
MNPARRVRALTHSPAFDWPRVDLRSIGLRTLPFVFCLGSALLLTAARLEITRLRYELSDLNRQRQSVSAEVARLEVESAALASPKRIERMARDMGFVYPNRDWVVMLDE